MSHGIPFRPLSFHRASHEPKTVASDRGRHINLPSFPHVDLVSLVHCEKEIQTQTHIIVFIVGMLSGIVFVLVVKIEFNVFAYGK